MSTKNIVDISLIRQLSSKLLSVISEGSGDSLILNTMPDSKKLEEYKETIDKLILNNPMSGDGVFFSRFLEEEKKSGSKNYDLFERLTKLQSIKNSINQAETKSSVSSALQNLDSEIDQNKNYISLKPEYAQAVKNVIDTAVNLRHKIDPFKVDENNFNFLLALGKYQLGAAKKVKLLLDWRAEEMSRELDKIDKNDTQSLSDFSMKLKETQAILKPLHDKAHEIYEFAASLFSKFIKMNDAVIGNIK